MKFNTFEGIHLDEAVINQIAKKLNNTKVYLEPQVIEHGKSIEFCDILLIGTNYNLIISLKQKLSKSDGEIEKGFKRGLFNNKGVIGKSHNQLKTAYNNIESIVTEKNKSRIVLDSKNKNIFITALGELSKSDRAIYNKGNQKTEYSTSQANSIQTKPIDGLRIYKTTDGYKCSLANDTAYEYKINKESGMNEIIMGFDELLGLLAIEKDCLFDSADKIGKFIEWSQEKFNGEYEQKIYPLASLYAQCIRGGDLYRHAYIIVTHIDEGKFSINRDGEILMRSCHVPIVLELPGLSELARKCKITHQIDILIRTCLENELRYINKKEACIGTVAYQKMIVYKDIISELSKVAKGEKRNSEIFIACNNVVYRI